MRMTRGVRAMQQTRLVQLPPQPHYVGNHACSRDCIHLAFLHSIDDWMSVYVWSLKRHSESHDQVVTTYSQFDLPFQWLLTGWSRGLVQLIPCITKLSYFDTSNSSPFSCLSHHNSFKHTVNRSANKPSILLWNLSMRESRSGTKVTWLQKCTCCKWEELWRPPTEGLKMTSPFDKHPTEEICATAISHWGENRHQPSTSVVWSHHYNRDLD